MIMQIQITYNLIDGAKSLLWYDAKTETSVLGTELGLLIYVKIILCHIINMAR